MIFCDVSNNLGHVLISIADGIVENLISAQVKIICPVIAAGFGVTQFFDLLVSIFVIFISLRW
jgi:hypothetical protein